MSSVISMSKGQNVNLTKEAPGIVKFVVGLGWNEAVQQGVEFDLDVSALLLDENDKIINCDFNSGVVCYKNLRSSCGSVIHSGDNKTGSGTGDKEQISVNVSTLPQNVKKINFFADIYEAVKRRQNFGQVINSYARLFNPIDNVEICKFDLNEDYSANTSVVIASFYKKDNDWKFKAEGIGSNITLAEYISKAGIQANYN